MRSRSHFATGIDAVVSLRHAFASRPEVAAGELLAFRAGGGLADDVDVGQQLFDRSMARMAPPSGPAPRSPFDGADRSIKEAVVGIPLRVSACLA
jgi:hypothetical protein